MSGNITIKGDKELIAKLKQNATLNDVKRVVRKNGSDLQRNMQEKADFTKGYATGETKRSIGLEITDGGLTAEVGPTTEYAPYLEYGTRFMEAQPFVRPALDEQGKKFISDLNKLMR